MIIAIDGPAGSGKTTIGRLLAAELKFAVVDTGLFYRAVTVEAHRRKIPSADRGAVVAMARDLDIRVNTSPDITPGETLVSVDGRDLSREALDPALAPELAEIAQIPEVRTLLLEPQRRAAAGSAVVLGRDIGTVVFPNADRKFFFTASAAERLARRRRELNRADGGHLSDSLLEAEIDARDRADSERQVAPLLRASDAIIVETEGKSVHRVFQEVMAQLPAGR